MVWKVKFFQTARGNYPAKEFIEKLNRKDYLRALRTVSFLQNFGPFIKMPYARKITNNLFELRVKGSESVRILYTKIGQTYYLIHAFKKKKQKVPKKEIETALDRIMELI